MSAANLQLVKWSFPAFALLVGFFWYKRRREDRVDPGGVSGKVYSESRKKKEVSSKESKDQKSFNLYDSGIHIDESFGLNSSQQTTEELVRSPRRVSESLDIPTRRSGSQGISMKSGNSSGSDPESWYKEIDDVPEPKAVVLGSNPKSANFEMLARGGKSGTIFEGGDRTSVENKVAKLFENVTEEEEPASSGPSKTSAAVYVDESGRECAAGEERMESCAKSLNAMSMSEAKSEGQVICERDSANHSPVSGVLEGSVTDEVGSEGSTDSGKGGSIKGSGKLTKTGTTYHFSMPEKYVGKLFGKWRSFMHQIKAKCGATLVVERRRMQRDFRICSLDGPPEAIRMALDMIRKEFPKDNFPQVTLEQISPINAGGEQLVSELVHLPLVDGVNNDVIVCHVHMPNCLFVHLPTHPSYPSLRVLDQHMTRVYNTVESPPVPEQLTPGMLVVTKWYDLWVRANVVTPDPNGQNNLVCLVDHGGYWTVSNADMRKIRFDYLSLPFQAIEVNLANIQPVGGTWNQEAYNVVAQICAGSIGQAQIEGYIDSNVYVSLYINIPKYGVISLADELIARGYAEPAALSDMVPGAHLTTA